MAARSLSRQFGEARREFKDLSIGELKDFEKMFLEYDRDKDTFLNLQELKYLMEKLGMPQTHLALKAMIKEVDEDNDGMMAYREFLLIFRYAKTGKLKSSGLMAIANAKISVHADKMMVGGAKNFFEQKAAAQNNDVAAKDAAYHAERKKEAEAKKQRQAAFKQKSSLWS